MNNEFVFQNMITYIGNKRTLLPNIEQTVIDIKRSLKKDLVTSLDGFSGSGVVSRMLKYHSKILFVNDLEPYSYHINQCYLSNPNEELRNNIRQFIDSLNHLTHDQIGIISNNYAPKNSKNIQQDERVFYTTENANIIDSIRDQINHLPSQYFPYLIAPLLVKASIHTNTSGVFKGFHKKNGIGHFGGKGEHAINSRITKKIILDQPIFSDQSHRCLVNHNNMDINELIHDLPLVDIAYLDPPYNQHPYGSNYFMLNTILHNEITGDLSKVSGIPDNWNRSDYNYKKSALQSMKHLLMNINAKYIILSYNDEGIITKQELIILFNELDLFFQLKEIQYNTYKGSRNLNDRNKDVTEYLWILSPLYDIIEPYNLTPLI
jgi:adenine-specific DNA-methyltransferase